MRDGQAETALVIGAGMVGLACALRLQRQGLRTTLVDPMNGTAASLGNAGHVAIEQVEPLASWSTIRSAPRRLFAFGGALDVRDLRRNAPWIARFIRAAGTQRFRHGRTALAGLLEHAMPAWQRLVVDIERPGLLMRDGHVVLWESPRTASRGRATWHAADTGRASVRDLASDELDAFAEQLHQRPVGGVRFDGTGQIVDLPQTLEVLRRAFERSGGSCVCGLVQTLDTQGGRAEAVLDGGQRSGADIVLVAAGVHSAELMARVGPRPPLIAERGYHVQWSDHAWPAGMPPVVFEDRSMIVTRFRDGLRAASFVEFAHTDSPPDPRKWAALRAHVAALGLPVAGQARDWFGARPTLPDYLPAIGRSRAVPNLFYAFGHQHLGLTLAPVTAEAVVALVAGELPPVPLAPFDLQRFSGAPA